MLYGMPHLLNVDPRLVSLMIRAAVARDIIIAAGARTYEQEEQAIAAGRSNLTDPLRSKHVIDPPDRPLALAVDAAPYTPGQPIDWKNIPAFSALAAHVKQVALEMDLAISWGGDWTHVQVKDYDHFELKE